MRNYVAELGALATVVMVFFIGIQSRIIRDKFELENRPYFYVTPRPNATLVPTLLAGVSVSYNNSGNFAAKNIEITDIALYSDKSITRYPVKEWWDENHGGLQENNFVPPNAKDFWHLDCRAGMQEYDGRQKRYIQFSIRAKYKGFDAEEYKYGLDYVYAIEGLLVNGQPKPLQLYARQYFGENGESAPEIKYLLDKYKNKLKQ